MEIQHTIATLALYRFFVTGLGYEGVTENSSTLMQQLDLTLKYVFPDLFDDDTVGDGCNLMETDIVDNHDSIGNSPSPV